MVERGSDELTGDGVRAQRGWLDGLSPHLFECSALGGELSYHRIDGDFARLSLTRFRVNGE